MMADVGTVLWKELKEIPRQSSGRRGGPVSILVVIALIGVFVPLQAGVKFLNPSQLGVIVVLPVMMILAVIADSFAGERERHTLETLLASPLSDRAILFGKIAAAVGWGWGISMLSLALGLVTVNLKFGEGKLLMFAPDTALAVVLGSLLGGIFMASAGVLVSLRASTVRQAQQTLSMSFLVLIAARRAASAFGSAADRSPVTLRVNGDLAPAPGSVLSSEDTRNLLLPLLSQNQHQELQRNKSVDLCFTREGIGRFRANLHYQRGTLAAALRLLPDKIPTLESLHLPPTIKKLVESSRQGLILVCGATGCGKSSTLAALVDLINTHRRNHIVTIEDPVEFVHTNRNSIVEQIEVGQDAPDFASSVRSVLRQAPDVILVGEMRDAETIATALTAAETGHLVLSTLHTNDTSQAVSRILDSFPANNQIQFRQQLSLALLAIIAQQLVPSATQGGLYPAVEIMVATRAVRNLIRKGEDHQLYTAIGTGRSEGMMPWTIAGG